MIHHCLVELMLCECSKLVHMPRFIWHLGSVVMNLLLVLSDILSEALRFLMCGRRSFLGSRCISLDVLCELVSGAKFLAPLANTLALTPGIHQASYSATLRLRIAI